MNDVRTTDTMSLKDLGEICDFCMTSQDSPAAWSYYHIMGHVTCQSCDLGQSQSLKQTYDRDLAFRSKCYEKHVQPERLIQHSAALYQFYMYSQILECKILSI